MNRASLLDQIRKESETYFEWPSADRRSVSLTSCILFAEHIADQQTSALRARVAELEGNAKPALIVPISETDLSLEACNADPGDWNDLRFAGCWHKGYEAGFRAAESYHSAKLGKASPPAPMVPEGWKLVPIEPTDEMIEVGCDVANAYRVDIDRAYEAMLAAAPEVDRG